MRYVKTCLICLCSSLIAACGLDVATSAATHAALQKERVKQADSVKRSVQRQLDEATAAMQARLPDQDVN